MRGSKRRSAGCSAPAFAREDTNFPVQYIGANDQRRREPFPTQIRVLRWHDDRNGAGSSRTNGRNSSTLHLWQSAAGAVPQAWAAGSAFMLTQALLGFLPDAPREKLYIDPALPYWLPDLAVYDLHIGKHKLDIRFWREDEDTAFEVIKGDPTLVERCDIASKVAQLRTASDTNTCA
jgi:hypothetical protein